MSSDAAPISSPVEKDERKRRLVLLALAALVVLIAAGGAAAFLLAGDGEKAQPREKPHPEVLLVSAASPGPNPFTPPVDPADPAEAAAAVGARPQSGTVPPAGSPLYGGSGDARVCDVEAMIRYLEQNPAKGRAWAGAVGVPYDVLAPYVRSLTPTVLLYDIRVTNHGFASGRATPFQAVLQAGTAVLIDETGQPVAKCKCGNPLRPPIPTRGQPDYTGKAWPGFDAGSAVTVATTPANVPANATDPRKILADAALECRFSGGTQAAGPESYVVKETAKAGVFEVTTVHRFGSEQYGAPASQARWEIDVASKTIKPLDDGARKIVETCPSAFAAGDEPTTQRRESPDTTVPAEVASAPPPGAQKLLEVLSVARVEPGTGTASTFTLDRRTKIVWIRTYHWLGGGALGTIALRSGDGTLYGPWPASGRPGQDGRPNANWDVSPNVVLPPGTYEVVDSDPGTWSQNAETGGRGMVWVYGTSPGS